jgi:antitoxin component YwqK of YwqJK toxin-antitoxin module
MRLLFSAFLLAVMLAIGCGRSKAPVTTDAAGGQKIEKDYFADGTLKSVTRLNPDGSLLGRLYYSNGVPEHADYFDDQKRVRRTLLYRADGTAQTSREFDEHGKLVAEQQLDATCAPIQKTP